MELLQTMGIHKGSGRKRKIEKSYQYDALADDEIRTLVIHPGEEQEKLKASIERHKLNDTEKQYTALSYVWGSTERDSELWIEEHCIPITRSAGILLKRVRDAQESMRVWLDAICINQEEQKERSHQVSLMNSIFAGAARVVIWVGDSDAHTASLFQVFKRWEEHQNAAASSSDSSTNLDQDSLKKVTEFAKRPWFQRAWTFQEACLSDRAEIACGNHRLSWRTFIMAALYIKDRGRLYVFGNTADSIMALAHFSAANPEKEMPFLSVLLPLTRDLKSLDPRDKVFSLLGIVEKEGLGAFEPDYTMNMAGVYTLCARAMITQEGGLSVLSGTQMASKNATLPTWVPDWTQRRKTAYIHGFEWPSRGSFAHQINRNAPFDNDVASAGSLGSRGNLSLRGAQIDTVKIVIKPRRLLKLLGTIPESPQEYPWRRRFDQRVEDLRRVICPSDDGPRLLRTLCANRADGVGSMPTYSSSFAVSAGIDENWTLEADTEGLRNTVAYILTFLPNRAVFRTRKGLMGIGPDYMTKGDEVWNIVGGDVPFALRRCDKLFGKQGPPQFTLVGECYIDRIMDGELWSQQSESLVVGNELEFKNIEIV